MYAPYDLRVKIKCYFFNKKQKLFKQKVLILIIISYIIVITDRGKSPKIQWDRKSPERSRALAIYV